jgi:hypothetical protein
LFIFFKFFCEVFFDTDGHRKTQKHLIFVCLKINFVSNNYKKKHLKKMGEFSATIIWIILVIIIVAVYILLHCEFGPGLYVSEKCGAYQWTSYDTNEGACDKKDSDQYHIPKQIFFYWHTHKLPQKIKIMTDHWKKVLGEEWKFIQLHDENLQQFISRKVPTFDIVQAKSDWIRLEVLSKNGGIWMDASIMLHRKDIFESFYHRAVRDHVDFAGFHVDYLSTNPNYPVIENWFMMSPPHSAFIQEWKEEYDVAIATGFYKYKKQNIQDGVDVQHLFLHWRDVDVYLTQHLCAQRIFQLRHGLKRYRILLERAEDHMFRIHQSCLFNLLPLIGNCATRKSALKIPYIKLRGGDRMFTTVSRLKKLYDL